MITGAAGGLGRAMACECGRRGYDLFLTDINDKGLAPLKTGLERQFGVNVTTLASNLTSPASLDSLMAEVDRRGILFDMLLNVAGVDDEGAFVDMDREKVVGIAAINDVATLRITHSVLQRRRPGSKFAIVFVSSMASQFPIPLKATYAASKRFLLDFAEALHAELKPSGVNVLALCPGGMATKDSVIKAIEVQGLGGAVTTNHMELLTRRTIDRVLKGKTVYIPGAWNRTFAFFGKIVPRRVIASYLYKRWDKAQAKWLKG